ncbi:HC-toxin synthetase 1 [Colletotrichum chlorophyti]|uniref:HC-toxin synthetase 1 n=1 Tax=Colletotrichum chlorophyti TaxID=708187 RepID=A0A1Q8RV72_9PEZI|nr:HC-toxin synthetase 1 [Colletotrichum chlorophyti]
MCPAWVVNPLKASELAAMGGVGELYIEGTCLARGYLGNDEATASAFIVDPAWFPGGSKAW